MATQLICSIDECARRTVARGWCKYHYNLWKRNGVPERVRAHTGATGDFLISHVSTKHENCILWPYSVSGNGYGSGRVSGVKSNRAHRIMCELAHGSAPSPAHDAAHSCGIRACVNPNHLRWATRSENMQDTVEHGTHKRGKNCHFAKLTKGQVLEIRGMLSSHSQASIAKQFGVTSGAIWSIANKKSWGWFD